MTIDYGTTELDATQVADMLGVEWTLQRLYGMYGPGTIFTVNVEQDDDPGIKPWDCEPFHYAVFNLSKDYMLEDVACDGFPDELSQAVSELNYRHGMFGYERWRENLPLRVLKRFARLKGWLVELVQLQNYNIYANVLIFAESWSELGCSRTAEEVLDSVKTEWEQYFAGEVYGYTLEGPDGEGDSCWGFYGLDQVSEDVEQQILYAVQIRSKENIQAKTV